MINRILKWFLSLRNKLFKESEVYSIRYCEDVPDNVKPYVIYVIGENKCYWMALFKCPCGCDDEINLNLLDNTSPSWEIDHNVDEPSISPSIRRIKKCKSHFFIKRGKVVW